MLQLEDLLAPIAGDNPSGTDLELDVLFNNLREARREDPFADPVKEADFREVGKQARKALATRSKDLRICTFITEAELYLEGPAALPSCLQLMLDLQKTFWPTLYPNAIDGPNSRSDELNFSVGQLRKGLHSFPLTRNGLTRTQFHEAQQLGYDVKNENAEAEEKRQKSRTDWLAANRPTAEDFDKAVLATSTEFYREAVDGLKESTQLLQALDRYQDAVYAKPPGLASLAEEIEAVLNLVSQFHQVKIEDDRRQLEERQKIAAKKAAAAAAASSSPLSPPVSPVQPVAPAARQETFPAALPGPPRQAPTSTAPSDPYAQVLLGAQTLFEENPSSPVPYLVCAALRMGETRLQSGTPGPGFAVGPAADTRMKLKAFAAQYEWTELLRAALPVLATPAARAWIDVHRYIWRAARETGADALASAVIGSVRALLIECPEVRHWTLEDDTPAANPETQAWIDAEVLPPPDEPQPVQREWPPATSHNTESTEITESAYDSALQLIAEGRVDDAVAWMITQAEAHTSGRARFLARVDLARICLAAGRLRVARVLLQDLVEEFDRRDLSSWEKSAFLASPLVSLLQSIGEDAEELRPQLITRICLLDPGLAVEIGAA